MPAKKTTRPLPRFMTASKGAYKYQRRVPKDAQAFLARKMWDFSLGSELPRAMARCAALTQEHDRWLELANDKEAREEMLRNARGIAPAANYAAIAEDTPELLEATWRDTADYLSGASALARPMERETLAIFAYQAFGDRSYIDQIEAPSPMLTEAVNFPVAAPPAANDLVNHALYNGMKSALDARLAELTNAAKGTDPHRLSNLCERYLDLQGASDQTKRSYRGKTNRLIDHLGDLPLYQFTPEKLRLHRDYLLDEGLSPNSVTQYFAPTKAIMRWAYQEDLVLGFDTLPTDKVKMPGGGKAIEERRWQRFDDDEIKTVWTLLQNGWGPDSRLSTTRQSAFKMVFRVMLYTALRPVEVFRLTPKDVTEDLIKITKTKTRIARDLPLSIHIADFHRFMEDAGFSGLGKPESMAQKMSDTFTQTIRAGGFNNDRHVLYSAKDTLVDRLQRAQRTEDVIRGITGHVSGQGHLRSYKTRLNDSPEGLALMREALDAIEYW